ncbi:MAG: hypothetical protein M3Z05_20905 [Gemmatimonadota bacterium]|nr:hypothetical protein [Gemmatimonadota bacterium]
MAFTFGARIESYDEKRPLAREMATLLAQGVRQELHLPIPLLFPLFDPDSIALPRLGAGQRLLMASPSIAVTYRMIWDGRHLRNVQRSAGVSTDAFDRAVAQALVALDTSGMLPPLPSELGSAPLELRLGISRSDPPNVLLTSMLSDRQPAEALIRTRLPVWPVTATSHPLRGVTLASVFDRRVFTGHDEQATVEMAVDADGRVYPQSVRVLEYSSAAVLVGVQQRLATWRVHPLEIAGCPVPSLNTIVTTEFRAR